MRRSAKACLVIGITVFLLGLLYLVAYYLDQGFTHVDLLFSLGYVNLAVALVLFFVGAVIALTGLLIAVLTRTRHP